MELTDRQKIIQLIKVKPMDALSLSQAISKTQRVVEGHLEHIEKSNKNNFVITPAECRECGFKYRDRNRKTKPSRCPKCRSEYHLAPQFFIKSQR